MHGRDVVFGQRRPVLFDQSTADLSSVALELLRRHLADFCYFSLASRFHLPFHRRGPTSDHHYQQTVGRVNHSLNRIVNM